MSDFSENEDDPAVYESSGDEWDEEVEKKRNKRRTSQRLSKRPRITHIESSDSEDEDDMLRTSNGVNRKIKKPPPKTPVIYKTATPPVEQQVSALPIQHNFIAGSFVISKKDAQEGNPSNPPCIWKIDGKALLQKFEPFEEDGKIRHRNTSIYTGWSSLDKDNYVSIHVDIFLHSGQKMIVELDWSQLKTIVIDSD